MRRGGFRLAWAMVLIGSLASGCQLPKPRKPYPPDPLFESKPPVEKPADNPTTPSSARPAPPPLIAAAIAAPLPPHFPSCFQSAPLNPSPPGREDRDRFAVDHPSAMTPVLAPSGSHRPPAPTTRPGEETGEEESSPSPAVSGHAGDFRWLVGVLEKQIDGGLMLRFADGSPPFSGTVCLEPAAMLARFADGELIRVEGLPVPRLTAPGDPWDDPPRYRVIAASRAQ